MSLKEEFELLRRVPMFAEIEPAKLKLLAFMSERIGFDPGKQLMRQGDPSDAAYLIIDGHAEVILETPAGPVVVATAGANETVGDMGNLEQRTTRRDRPRQRPCDCPSHLQGSVHAHGSRIPEHGGLNHAGTGAAARRDESSAERGACRSQAIARSSWHRRLIRT